MSEKEMTAFFERTFKIASEKEMAFLAHDLSGCLCKGDVVFLKGTLGMGKSFFARSFIRALAGHENLEVPSPTFTLVQVYDDLKIPVWHFDLYRLESPEEAFEIGLEEALSEGISLIEWPERLGKITLPNVLNLEISVPEEQGADSSARLVTLRGDFKGKLDGKIKGEVYDHTAL